MSHCVGIRNGSVCYIEDDHNNDYYEMLSNMLSRGDLLYSRGIKISSDRTHLVYMNWGR